MEPFFMIGLAIIAVLLLLGFMAAGVGAFYWGPGLNLAAFLLLIPTFLVLFLAHKQAPSTATATPTTTVASV